MDPLLSPWDALWSRQLLVPKAHTTAMHRAARSHTPSTKDQGQGCLSRSRCFQALGLQHAQQGSAEWAVEEEEFSQAWGTTWTSSITTAGAGGSNFPQYQQGLTYFKCSETICPPFLSMTTFWDIFSMPNLDGKAFFLLSMSPPNHHMIPGPIAWGITPGEGQQSSQSWDQQTPAPGRNSRQDRQEKPVYMKEGFCSSAPPAQRSGVLFLQSLSRAGLSRPPLLPPFGRGPRSGDKCPRPARCCCGRGALCCHLCRGCKKEETGMRAPRCQLHFH